MKRLREEIKKAGPGPHKKLVWSASENLKIEANIQKVLSQLHQREISLWDKRISQYELSGEIIGYVE